MTFTSIVSGDITSGSAVSSSGFGTKVKNNFDDLNTRLATQELLSATTGTWYSVSNNTTGTKITSEIGLTTWAPISVTPSGVSVSGDTFTVTNAGRYAIGAGMFGNVQGTTQKGYVGFSIKNVANTVIYAYSSLYFDNAAGTTATNALLGNISTAPGGVNLGAGATFKVWMYCNNTNGFVMAGDGTNFATWCSVQRVG